MYSIKQGEQYTNTSNNGPSRKQTTSVQRTDHLPPIDRTTNLNSEQRTLMSPRCTLIITKLPPKTDSETIATPTNSLSTLVDGFHKIVRHHRWIQRPGITAAYRAGLFLSRYSNGERPHRVQQPEHTLPNTF